MKKSAIILGATGATGRELLHLLLNDNRYGKVKLFSRHSVNLEHEKLEEYVTDMYSLHQMKKHFTADEVYCCIGVTKLNGPDEHTCMKADYHIPVTAAQLAKKNGIDTFIVISSYTADIDSEGFYRRIKGEMEYDVLGVHIPHTYLLKPLVIDAQRNKKHKREIVLNGFLKLLNPFLIGAAANLKCFSAMMIAKSMVWLANNPCDELFVKGDKISRYSKDEEAYGIETGNMVLQGY